MSACPSRESLERFVTGVAEPAEAAAVEAHLETCPDCDATVRELRANEQFLTHLRQTLKEVARNGANSSSAGLSWPEPAEGGGIAAPNADELHLPGYRIEAELHRGGQGVLYRGVQESTQRAVAIKVVRGDGRSPRDRDRFQREVRLLAELRHPHVVTIHDSGEVGRCQYFIMDFVSGRRLDDYLAAAQPERRDLLRLFVQICDAVHAAHLKGIMHRDLKPSNILIDEHGQPRVLDFGLAKHTLDTVGDPGKHDVTVTGEFFGSLPWASPEQAAADPAKVDLRTDVYSLGVILYQLLTGRFPYDLTGTTRQIIDGIQHTPPRPPRQIVPSIDADLETIVLRCLSKEPGRRYQTAGELARDIQHYLAGEPIEARRDSGWYVLRKTVWRHRLAGTIALAFLLLIVVGLVTSTAGWAIAEDRLRNEQDQLAVTQLFGGLGRLGDADLRTYARDMVALSDFVESASENRRLPQVLERQSQELDEFVSTLDSVIRQGQIPTIAELYRVEPAFATALDELPVHSQGQIVSDSLITRLKQSIHVPPPRRHAQTQRECLQMLAHMAPADPVLRQMHAALAALEDTLQPRFSESFDRTPSGSVPPGWTGEMSAEGTLRVDAKSGALVICSRSDEAGAAIWSLPRSVSAEVVALRARVSTHVTDPNKMESAGFEVDLLGDDVICEYAIKPDKIVQSVPLELRYFPAWDAFDLLVDGEYECEDRSCTSPGPVTGIRFTARHNTTVELDDVVLRVGHRPLKQELGHFVPVTTTNELGYELIGWWPMSLGSVVAGDFDGDGRTELAASDLDSPGLVRIFRITEPGHRFEPLARLESKHRLHRDLLEPQCVVGNHLVLYGDWETVSPLAPDSVLRFTSGVRIVAFDSDWRETIIDEQRYERVTEGHAANMSYGDGRTGFVVGLNQRARLLEFFERHEGSDAYTRLGRYALISHSDERDGSQSSEAASGDHEARRVSLNGVDGRQGSVSAARGEAQTEQAPAVTEQASPMLTIKPVIAEDLPEDRCDILALGASDIDGDGDDDLVASVGHPRYHNIVILMDGTNPIGIEHRQPNNANAAHARVEGGFVTLADAATSGPPRPRQLLVTCNQIGGCDVEATILADGETLWRAKLAGCPLSGAGVRPAYLSAVNAPPHEVLLLAVAYNGTWLFEKAD